ncbi:hypothetical protein MCOR25_000876 [Pyricularia grisea]|nr:hypothetical protein MCOR25_000876 [Pyricularia grisea]
MAAVISSATPDAPLQSRIVDDKSPICIPFILERLSVWRKVRDENDRRPFFIGLNGVQGVGKTTLVRALAETLQQREMLETIVVSIDDFYLGHQTQLALAESQPDNSLIQYRGEPGTHDIELMQSFFTAVINGQPTKIPQYDKGAYSGLGDRAPESTWPSINGPDQRPVQVVLVEGWCVGFRALKPEAVVEKWRSPDIRTLRNHRTEHLLFVNEKLGAYDDVLTNNFDAFVHIDAQQLEYVYDWRQEQEAQLRNERGTGMSDEQVVRFVDAYYPAYELYSDGVRAGVLLPERPGCQLTLIVDRHRRVVEHFVL